MNLSSIPQTRLLYYEDAYMKTFDAKILKVTELEGKQAIILDSTAFYPTGGGQPCDIGVIKCESGMAKIIDVQMRQGIVYHVMGEIIGSIVEGNYASGIINWNRRYALMRNHTASHILAVAVRKAVNKPLEIVGSGLDVDKARIDFAFEGPLREFFPQIEQIATTIIKENRPVIIKVMPRNLAEEYVKKFDENLKTLPAHVKEVRIVEIENWHACACGGTHVKSTLELGIIKLLGRASKGKGVQRIEFVSQNP